MWQQWRRQRSGFDEQWSMMTDLMSGRGKLGRKFLCDSEERMSSLLIQDS